MSDKPSKPVFALAKAGSNGKGLKFIGKNHRTQDLAVKARDEYLKQHDEKVAIYKLTFGLVPAYVTGDKLFD